MPTISIDLNKLSDQELQELNNSTKLALEKRKSEEDNRKETSAYQDLANEKLLIEKEIDSFMKNNTGFTFSINLPLTFEVKCECNYDTSHHAILELCDAIKYRRLLASECDIFYYSGKIKLPKSFENLTPKQNAVIKQELKKRYEDVCDDFILPFVPEEIISVEKTLIKQCLQWSKKVEKSGYSVSEF